MVLNILDAYFESFAATELPVWRVFKIGPSVLLRSSNRSRRSRLQPRPAVPAATTSASRAAWRWDIHKLRLPAIAPVDAGGGNARE